MEFNTLKTSHAEWDTQNVLKGVCLCTKDMEHKWHKATTVKS